MAAAWQQEIVDLHRFFEGYFGGRTGDSLDRLAGALAAEFTMAGPDGVVADRAAVMAGVRSGHGSNPELTITTSDHRLVAEGPELVVAGYVETHTWPDGEHRRQATVVFRREPDGPNGLRWVRVQESWIDPSS